MLTPVTIIVMAFQVYALVGVLFAVPFVLRGAARLDSDAVEASWGFRVLIFPGAAALWPWLLLRWMRAGGSR
jgi:hypothetical protein